MPYGAQVKFGIARQASVGSGGAVTAPGSFHHIPLISSDIGFEKDEVISENLTGKFEQGAVYDGLSRIAGTLEFEPEPWSIGAVLDACVNHPTAVTSGSLKTFRFIPRTADYSGFMVNEPYSIYSQFSGVDSAELYFDTQFSQIEFAFAQGQLMRARATVVGGRRVATGVGSLALALHNADAQANWLWDTTSISYAGSALGEMSEITVSLNESIEPLYTLNNQLTPYKYTRTGFREVTVNGTIYFTGRDQYNDFINGTKRRLVITSRNVRTEIQSGFYPTLEVDIPQLKLTQFKPAIGGAGEVAVQFTGRAILDATSNYSAQFTLTNTFANATF